MKAPSLPDPCPPPLPSWGQHTMSGVNKRCLGVVASTPCALITHCLQVVLNGVFQSLDVGPGNHLCRISVCWCRVCSCAYVWLIFLAPPMFSFRPIVSLSLSALCLILSPRLPQLSTAPSPVHVAIFLSPASVHGFITLNP